MITTTKIENRFKKRLQTDQYLYQNNFNYGINGIIQCGLNNKTINKLADYLDSYTKVNWAITEKEIIFCCNAISYKTLGEINKIINIKYVYCSNLGNIILLWSY